jgi:hypothetical protein
MVFIPHFSGSTVSQKEYNSMLSNRDRLEEALE